MSSGWATTPSAVSQSSGSGASVMTVSGLMNTIGTSSPIALPRTVAMRRPGCTASFGSPDASPRSAAHRRDRRRCTRCRRTTRAAGRARPRLLVGTCDQLEDHFARAQERLAQTGAARRHARGGPRNRAPRAPRWCGGRRPSRPRDGRSTSPRSGARRGAACRFLVRDHVGRQTIDLVVPAGTPASVHADTPRPLPPTRIATAPTARPDRRSRVKPAAAHAAADPAASRPTSAGLTSRRARRSGRARQHLVAAAARERAARPR